MSSAIIASVADDFLQRLFPLDIRHSLDAIIACGFGTTVGRNNPLILHYLVVIMQPSFLHVSNRAFNSCGDYFVFHLLPLGTVLLVNHYDIDSLNDGLGYRLHDVVLFRFAELAFEAEVPALEKHTGVTQPRAAYKKLLQRTPAAWRLPDEVAEIVLVLLVGHKLRDDGGHYAHALVAPASGADGVLEAAADASEAR